MDRVSTTRELSRQLREAQSSRVPVKPLTDEYPDLTMREAYEVQQIGIEALGEPQVGYKLGFTSEAMRCQMGMESPNYGILTEAMETEREIEFESLIHPRIEPEIALIIGVDLHGNPTSDEIRSAVEQVCAAIEVVDSRFVDYRFLLPDNTADNSSAARFVLGESVAPRSIRNLRSVEVSLRKDGEHVDSGVGSNAMGDPMAAVAWLVNALYDRGSTLAAGSIVLTGGLTKAHVARGGAVFIADFGVLGRVEARFE